MCCDSATRLLSNAYASLSLFTPAPASALRCCESPAACGVCGWAPPDASTRVFCGTDLGYLSSFEWCFS
jgi:hypothetical protein